MKFINLIKSNISYIVISIITIIFSILTISDSVASELNYSFPGEGIDYSTISWAEFPLNENGQEFNVNYKAWDIGQIGLRMSYDEPGDFELLIEDSTGGEYLQKYSIDDLETDDDVTWLNVDIHVTAGNLKIVLRNISAKELRVIGYSQESALDENGNPLLCLNMQVNAAAFPKEKAILFSVVWILLVLFGFLIIRQKYISFENLFIILYLTMGLLAFMVFSPFAEPDSGNHYRRAYAISEGDILPQLDEENSIGKSFNWPSTWETGDSVFVSWYEAANRTDFNVTDSNDTSYLTYTNIALYSPICHAIPALAMKITRTFFTPSIIIIEMVAKILNYIVIGILLYLGIRITPFGKEYFLWIIVHPFMMKQYTSISPDIMTAALVYLLTAIVLRLRYDPDAYAKKNYLAALYITPFLLGQFKIVYIAFCLLLFLIPISKFESKKSYYINATAIGLITLIPALAWFKVSSNILSLGYSTISSTNKVIAMNPVKYIPILLNTLRIRGYEYIMQFFGSALVFKDGTNNAVVLLFIILISAYVSRNIYKYKHNDSSAAIIVKKDTAMKVVFALAMTITTILIFTAEFVQWTDPGASNINGVHGRYFYPFIFPALILLTGMSDAKEINRETLKDSSYTTLFSLITVTMLFVAQLYIVYRL